MDLVEYNDDLILEKTISEGKKLYEKNDFFKDLVELMECERGKKFVEKYFTTGLDVKTSVMYIKCYEAITKKYEHSTGDELNKYIIIYMIRKMMTNGDIRNQIVKKMEIFSDGVDNKMEIFDDGDVKMLN